MKIEDQFNEALKGGKVRLYRKQGNVAIRPAAAGEVVETSIEGERETTNTAKAGDYVVRGPKGEQYVITPEILAERYAAPVSGSGPQGFREYPAKGTLHAFQYQGPPARFQAPWGEDMIVNPGDYIGTTHLGSGHFHRVEKNVFAETYVVADN